VPYINEFASSWALLAGSLLVAAPVIFFKVQGPSSPLHHGATLRDKKRACGLTTRAESVSIEEDLKFSDETIEDVKPLGIGEEMASEK
jgi:hypothetical protein